VNDQKEYAFKPANLVLSICEIYINLSKNESFTLAVSQDGRSYTPELFKLAENVLGEFFCIFFYLKDNWRKKSKNM
jgi:ubiquitin conjugation factor E4 A